MIARAIRYGHCATMAFHDGALAIRKAMKVCEEAEDMITAGAVGEVLQETLRHADELLDIADEGSALLI